MSDPAHRGRWSRLSKTAITDMALSAEALRVLAAFGTFADGDGHCYPSMSRIAALVGIGRRQVQRHVRVLEARGYVSTYRQKRIKGGGWAPNGYLLLFPPPPDEPAGPEQLDKTIGGYAGADRADRTTGRPDPIEADASSDDTSRSADASSNDTSQSEPQPSNGSAMRHPKADDASSEGTSDAASDVALTSPMNKPKGEQPQSRARARAGDDAAPLISNATAIESKVAPQAERLGLAGVARADPHGGLQGEERRWSERFAQAQGDLAAYREVSTAYMAWLDDRADPERSPTNDDDPIGN